ncbi:hypothetical protein BVRB_4g093920 [Beta vulgaris subsp. vulgaris]|nr:hypothetical protein BVRB_4g093920 [Beta vulgaris subsp. vulgaris]
MECETSPDPIEVDSGEEEVQEEVQNSKKSRKQETKRNVVHKPVLVSKNFKRQRRLTFGVWVHYDFLDEVDENGNLRCKCKKCGQSFNADSKMGTGNLKRHLKTCKMMRFRDVGQMILEKTSSGLDNVLPKFNADVFRELLALAIVRHDLTFQFVEYEAISRCFNYLHPDAKCVSRFTIKTDVMKMFKREKDKFKDELRLVSDEMVSSDNFMQRMATRMFEKFGKYWSEFSTIMAVAVVLDPRFKMQFIKWSFNKVYGFGADYESELFKVKDRLQHLYDGYAMSSVSAATNNVAGCRFAGATCDGTSDEFMTDFDEFSNEQHSESVKSDLVSYLEEPLIPRSSNIDIVSYWRTNEVRYPIVAKMAKDFLEIPMSTVASESAISTGGRVLDCYRSSLKPKTVEAIICLRDWAFGDGKSLFSFFVLSSLI